MRSPSSGRPAPPVSEAAVLRDVVAAVRSVTGVDLTGYRAETVLRRTAQHAAAAGGDVRDFAAGLAGDPVRARALLEAVLVQCTGWFRDERTWQVLAEEVLPRLAAGGRPLTAWSAGCGDGREVWSLASLLQVVAPDRWRLVASDLSGTARLAAAAAVYAGGPVVGDTHAATVLGATAERGPGGWRVGAALRSRVTVLRHDVRTPPPDAVGPAGCDVLLCRNVLMYLDDSEQERALDHLLGALRPGGVVVLGEAEVALGHRDVLVPVDLAARVYRLIATPVAG
ncbi:CheR family methyltransferase [Aquipuribacter sp. SD81]|uniref:CheR family methyltransferase n=1 Tax=Aquipuribacter sp. SD81 TaxID=3127703 RepID=UPI0030166F9E